MSPEKRAELEIPSEESLARLPQYWQRAIRSMMFEIDYLSGDVSLQKIKQSRNEPKKPRNCLF